MRNQNTQDKTAWFAEVKYLLAWSICSTAIGPFSHSYTLIYDMDSYLCIYVHISMIASNLYTAVHACAACEFCFVLQTLPLWSSIQKLQGSKTWEHFFLFFWQVATSHANSPICKRQGLHIQYAHCLHSSSTNHRGVCAYAKPAGNDYPTNGTFFV